LQISWKIIFTVIDNDDKTMINYKIKDVIHTFQLVIIQLLNHILNEASALLDHIGGNRLREVNGVIA
jgi:hypothetical protein